MTIETNLNPIYAQIGASITLVAVSKTQTEDRIRAAHAAGQRYFGENYLQEALPKIAALEDLKLIWHFIGAIQNNKTKLIAENFDWVQSVCQLKTIERLASQRPAQLPPLNVCLQVNIDRDETKSGVAPNEIMTLAQAVLAYPEQLCLRGLMAIPKANQASAETQKSFLSLQQLYLDLKEKGLPLDTLSMGMSQDFQLAIECGATMVRIGSAIFGSRTS